MQFVMLYRSTQIERVTDDSVGARTSSSIREDRLNRSNEWGTVRWKIMQRDIIGPLVFGDRCGS